MGENRIPGNYQMLNEKKTKQLTDFCMDKVNETHLGIAWVNEVWEFIDAFPLPELVIMKFDNLWQPLIFHAYTFRNNNAAVSFIEKLKNYQHKHPEHDFLDKIQCYERDISSPSSSRPFSKP